MFPGSSIAAWLGALRLVPCRNPYEQALKASMGGTRTADSETIGFQGCLHITIYLFIYYNFFMHMTERTTMSSFNKGDLQAPEQLRERAGEACALLKALANEDRLMLLCQIATARHNVGELEAVTGIRQPTLSQQLAVLRTEGLVETEKEGKFVYYRLANDNVVRIMRMLWEIYCAPK